MVEGASRWHRRGLALAFLPNMLQMLEMVVGTLPAPPRPPQPAARSSQAPCPCRGSARPVGGPTQAPLGPLLGLFRGTFGGILDLTLRPEEP